jgi:hypothetical protein
MDTVEYTNNAYSLAFSYVPLPTLDMNLTFNRSDAFNFGQKTTTNDTVELSTAARLYRDVNLTIDSGFTQVKNFDNDTKQSNLYLTGNLQAKLTPKISGNMIYRVTSSNSDIEEFASHGDFAGGENPVSQEGFSGNGDSVTQEGLLYVNYRPGRRLNISGSLKILDNEEVRTQQRMFTLDWRPLPVLTLNLRYQQTSTTPGDIHFDSIYASLKWRIFKFMDVLLYYSGSSGQSLVLRVYCRSKIELRLLV